MFSARKNKGIIQLFPLLVVALLLVGAVAIKTAEEKQSTDGKVLSKGSDDGGSSSSGSSGSGSSGESSDERRDSDDDRSGSSGSSPNTSVSASTKPAVRVRPTSEIEDEDAQEDEESEEAKPEFTKIRVEESKTRLERVFFEGGVKKKVELRNENGRVKVRVKTETAAGVETSQTLDLRPEDGRVTLKIEEGGVEREVTVKSLTDRFVIEQEGFEVPTNFPITVNTETSTITVETPAGIVNVRELPASAIQNLVASNVFDELESAELAETEEEAADPNEQVVYRIKGIRKANFLGIFSVDAPILAEVSAATGDQTFVSEPWYLRAFGFLFSQ